MVTGKTRKATPVLPAIFACLVLFGCVPFLKETKTVPSPASSSTAAPAVKVDPSDLIHTVQWKGESLSIIAKWYTGNVRNWKALAEYNPLNNPHHIRIGNRFFIPEDLLITRDPLPKAFVDSHQHQQKPETKGDEALPELFGPKELSGD